MIVNARVARVLGVVVAGCIGAACTAEGDDRKRGGHGSQRDSADGVVVIARSPYEVAPLGAIGSLTGHVGLEGSAPPDTTFPVPEGMRACGGAVKVSPVQGDSGGLADVVVWLEQVPRGKAPTEERRTSIAHEECQVSPRVQAVIAGTTILIGNADPVSHTARFSNYGARRPLLSIPFTASGQVVPSETLAREAGIIEASSAELPWARAYVAVFDHPYFAVTAVDGEFTLDSLPPGRYTLKAWHPRGAAVLTRAVEVTAGAETDVELRIWVR